MKAMALVLALALGGCAVTAPATPPAPGDWQGMADQAVAALGKYRGRVMIQAHNTDGIGRYSCKGSQIRLGTTGNARWLLAHELGHHINGHCEGALPIEIEANATAIKVLQVWGMTEEQAVTATSVHLNGLVRRGRTMTGHDYCAELGAIAKDYPRYAVEKCP